MMNKKTVLALMLGYVICSSALAAEAQLTTDQQKFSYALGLQVAQSMLRQGVQIDARAFSLAIEDALSGKEPRLSQKEMQAAFEKQEEQMNKERLVQAEKNKEAGKMFMAENKKKEGIKELPSGIQYRVIEAGKGAKPKPTDTVSVHYRGTLIDGKEFDSSHRRGEPTSLQLAHVIKGWQEVLPMMVEGAKWQVVIPPALAYGEQGAGIIGPNQTLLFDIELIAINPPEKK